MLISSIIALSLISITVVIHYEALRLTADALPNLRIPPRTRIIFVILAAFVAHIVEIHVYAIAYYGMANYGNLGTLKHFAGNFSGEFKDYIYYSMVSYTSLGLGDVWPEGGLRLITGIEALNGLVLITWTASFTYLTMEKFWGLPHLWRWKKK